MNAPAVVAVILVALALVAVGFVVTVVVLSNSSTRYTSDDELAGVRREVGT